MNYRDKHGRRIEIRQTVTGFCAKRLAPASRNVWLPWNFEGTFSRSEVVAQERLDAIEATKGLTPEGGGA
jgi:hypothetical protein